MKNAKDQGSVLNFLDWVYDHRSWDRWEILNASYFDSLFHIQHVFLMGFFFFWIWKIENKHTHTHKKNKITKNWKVTRVSNSPKSLYNFTKVLHKGALHLHTPKHLHNIV
jgi:hypothetical protein